MKKLVKFVQDYYWYFIFVPLAVVILSGNPAVAVPAAAIQSLALGMR